MKEFTIRNKREFQKENPSGLTYKTLLGKK